jgi:lipoyl(octanoyl) transferase
MVSARALESHGTRPIIGLVHSRMPGSPRVIDLGRMPYAAAYAEQCRHVDEVIAARERGGEIGRILLVEHDPPVITVTRRPTAPGNLLASSAELREAGIEVAETDRGGDITYHGPGQLVVYPILDLNLLNLRLHDYMRLLEGAVIDACATFGVRAQRDHCATGVWVGSETEGVPSAKVCAMGVRVRRWVSLHGLALNVTTNLDHFRFIVPCGLAGRAVTSLEKELGAGRPSMREAKAILSAALAQRIEHAALARSATMDG